MNKKEERGPFFIISLSRARGFGKKKNLFLSSLAQRRLEHLDQLPALVTLDHDVAPAEEAARNVDLRKSRPGLLKVFLSFFFEVEREERVSFFFSFFRS